MRIAKCIGIPGQGTRLEAPAIDRGKCPDCGLAASEIITPEGLVDLCVCGVGIIYDGVGNPVALLTTEQLLDAVCRMAPSRPKVVVEYKLPDPGTKGSIRRAPRVRASSVTAAK